MRREAMLYAKLDDHVVRCSLCAHRCTIKPGRRGICGVRENQEGILDTLVYGDAIAVHVDARLLRHTRQTTVAYGLIEWLEPGERVGLILRRFAKMLVQAAVPGAEGFGGLLLETIVEIFPDKGMGVEGTVDQ